MGAGAVTGRLVSHCCFGFLSFLAAFSHLSRSLLGIGGDSFLPEMAAATRPGPASRAYVISAGTSSAAVDSRKSFAQTRENAAGRHSCGLQ
jgi:hypothetical protein